MLQRSCFFTAAVLIVVFTMGSTQAFAARKNGAVAKPLSPEKVILATNAARTENNLPALASNTLLAASAQKKATDMAKLGLFAHDMPDGRHSWDYVTAAGYAYRNAGENLAVHFTSEEAIVEAWMNSPSHRANLLNKKYKDVGIGIAYGTFNGKPGYLVVQHLGEKQ